MKAEKGPSNAGGPSLARHEKGTRTSMRTNHHLTVSALAVLSCLINVIPVAAYQDARKDKGDAAVRSLIADLDEAWNRGDAPAWARHYAEDGELVNILGGVLSGRDAITRRHAEILSTFFQGSRHIGKIRNIRWLGPNAAVVDVDVELSNYKALPPGIQEDPDHVLRTRLKHILSRTGGEWKIVASQNTAVMPMQK
jgi:uncharacterized protein (TIGR02246 family)